jgi:hypothetical protein
MVQSMDGPLADTALPAQTGSVPALGSDLALAQATAEAVREVPGVLELSSGRSVLAATYGVRQHVTGVVIHHPRPGETSIEVHAVLGGLTPRGTALETGVASTRRQAVLLDVAETIRGTVDRVAFTLQLPTLLGVDVYIDDLR